jgi:hypothetical protein
MITSSDLAVNGGSSVVNGVIVVHDCYSPASPYGSKELLDAVGMQPRIAVGWTLADAKTNKVRMLDGSACWLVEVDDSLWLSPGGGLLAWDQYASPPA